MIVALDPGGVTGYATFRAGSFTSGEIPDGFDGFFEWCRGPEGNTLWWVTTHLIVERFTINAATHKKDPVGIRETLDIIGGARYLAATRDITFDNTQTPTQAKTFATDSNLKAMGWHHPTEGGHANDAARHLLTHLASVRNREVLRTLAEADD